MEGFLSSFEPILTKYKIEVVIVLIAFVIIFISIFILNSDSSLKNSQSDSSIQLTKNKPTNSKIVIVDISGAVEKPGVYDLILGSRLKNLIMIAGGLSSEADQAYFERNFNLAKQLQDQDKIYVPSREDTANLPTEKIYLPNANNNEYRASEKLNINTAAVEQLDSLPGIGTVTAQKIIKGRPYRSIDELIGKKILGKSAFEKIQELIAI